MASENQIIRERYKIIKEIARGGMGIVYLAKDLLTNSNVALKTSSWASEQKTREGFETEAKLLARLDHPGLPKVRDYFLLDDNFQALVMDFVEGETLAHILESGRYRVGPALDTDIVIGWSLQILDILRYLHGFTPPVIHRDIKPNNVTLKPDGTIVLLDFGLAKGSMQSVVSGGSGYSSLEQLNLTTTDARSDIYALGATLYHLLTKTTPLNAVTRFQAVFRAQAPSDVSGDATIPRIDPQKSVAEINPNVPREISAIIMKAMSVFPEDRFQTADEMKYAMLLAKKNLAGQEEEVGAETTIDTMVSSPGVKSVLDDDEENLAVWKSRKDSDLRTGEQTLPMVNAGAAELVQTQLSIPGGGTAGERDFPDPANDDYTTFDIPRTPPKKTGNGARYLVLGIAAIALLSLAGFAGWKFLIPQPAAENANIAKNSQSLTSPSGDSAKSAIEVSTYLVKSDGKETKADEDHLFADEEQFRFGVKTENHGFLYVISRNNEDKVLLAYPKQNQVDNSIEKGSEKAFPPDNGKFAFNKDSPSEMWAYFVVVDSREDELAKQIRTALGNNKEKSTSLSEVGKLLSDLDRLAEDAAKTGENKTETAKKVSVVITKLQKK